MELDMHKPTIVVTGGAGFIGSNCALLLAQKGYQVVVIDNFRYGQHSFCPDWARIINSDFSDLSVLDQIFTHYNVQAVMHFAGLIEVGASVKDPNAFYQENVVKVFNLLNKMREYHINKFVFSSSAAVYGIPKQMPIKEEQECNPVNPYGNTKLMVERILQDYSTAHGMHFVALRYFNAAGADIDHMLGELHDPETHVIPLLLKAAHERGEFSLFGDDYNTPDGTCVRDYLHVKDLATAHVKALEYLDGNKSGIFNLGTGVGVSVSELIETVKKVTRLPITVVEKERRVGDPAELVADPTRAQELLGWHARHSSLETIVADTWSFYQQKDSLLRHNGTQYQQRSVF